MKSDVVTRLVNEKIMALAGCVKLNGVDVELQDKEKKVTGIRSSLMHMFPTNRIVEEKRCPKCNCWHCICDLELEVDRDDKEQHERY